MADAAPDADDETPAMEAIREPIEGNLKRGTYSPAPISYINAAFVWGASEIYRQRFGIGINEWRMLGKLSTFPGSTPADAIRDLSMNKSTVSLSMTALLEKGLILTEYEGRMRRMYLTPRGADLYRAIRTIAEERERIMLEPLTDDEIAAFRDYLVRIAAQAPTLRRYDLRSLEEFAAEHEADDEPG